MRFLRTKTTMAGGALALLVFLQLGLLAVPERAYAGIPVAVDADAPFTAWVAGQEIKEGTNQTLIGALFTGIVNLLTFAANRLAYDAAVMLASGATDGGPLIEPRALEDFAKDYKAAVAGEAVYQLGQTLDDSGILKGFDLCAPSSPDITLQLRLGIKSLYDRPEANCDIKQVTANWEGFLAQTSADIQGGIFRNEVVLAELSQVFDPTTNEFAVGVGLYTDILGNSIEDGKLASAKLIANGPIKDVIDPITNRVETPSSMINYEYMQTQGQLKDVPLQIAYATLSNGDALKQIGISMGSVFLNTFLSQMTNKLYTGLFDFDNLESVDPFDEGLALTSSREAAQQRFRSLLAVAPLEVTNYSMLSEFASCPSTTRGLYNCVADSSMISAIARAEAGAPMTVEEAMEDGLIDGGWPLIPSTDSARDQDPYCYTYGFCHSNLVKLRKARILPIGWELAAESDANSSNDPVTLQEVIDGFDDCNDNGERDTNHPWCKLVDPNWVLKYPDTQCKALVYGQLLASSSGADRQQECVDMPSCIAEDENGTCTGGYGYCVREENTWRFRGDSCPEYAASCLSFENTAGEDANYLLNTVDYGPCDESNAGCLWYATAKEALDDGTYDWPTIADVPTEETTPGTYASRAYFNAEVEECDEDDGGCTQLIERNEDLRLNEVMNSGFEDDDNEDGVPDGWTFMNSVTYDTSGDYSRTGSDAINPGSSGIAYMAGIVLQQGTFYTLSYYGRLDDTSGEESSVLISIVDERTGAAVDLTGLSSSDGCTTYGTETGIWNVPGTDLTSDYARFTCTFTSPTLDDETANLYAYVDALEGDFWVDDVQLEQGEDESDYHDGYSDSNLQYAYVKVAPDYLGCDGSSDDPEECANYAAVCLESEVGCMAYAPANGDPTVYGVASALDECPSTCAGYDTYKQEATLYEPSGDFPVYFIPDTAESCSEEYVGCDEFTRLDDESLNYFTYLRACVTPDQASENSNGDQSATFYTWEGSDLTGYQLVTWTLLESDLDSYSASTYTTSGGSETSPGSAPCTSWTATDTGIECNDDADGDGQFDTDSASCDEHDDIFTNPNCREFYDADGAIHYRDWQYTVTVNDACTSYRKTDLIGLGDDDDADGVDDGEANCEDSGGYFDSATSTCRYYGYDEESAVCSESQNGCREYTGGRSRNSRLVMTETFEGGDLTDWEAASATDVTYSNESVATDGHSIASVGAAFWSYLYDDGAECDDGDTGTGCASTTGTLGGACTVDDGSQYCGTLEGELYTDKTYTVSFWAKGSGDIEVGFDIDADPAAASLGSGDPSFGTVALSSSEWEEYQLGPLDIDAATYANFGNDTVLAFIPSSTSITFYVDNIVIREGEDNLTLIKDSWVTPDECDENPEGQASAQYYLGCQEYTTSDGDTAYLKSFSSLCSESVVGCDDFFATHQSSSEYAQVFGATCSSLTGTVSTATDCYAEASGTSYDTTSDFLCTITAGEDSCTFDIDYYIPTATLAEHLSYGPETRVVPADSSEFLVVTDDVECDSSAMGCTEFGLPTFSQDRTAVTDSESVWLLDLPDDYGDILCAHSELFCDAWESDTKGTFYFKSPGEQTCEYRTDVTLSGTSYDGWFRTGTDEFCYGAGGCSESGAACSTDADCGESGGECVIDVGSYVIGGDTSGIWYNGDGDYDAWYGSCDENYDGCTEFEDVLDLAENAFYGTEDGESYFYLDNDALDESSLPSSQKCDGQVSQKEGCGLFNDITDSGYDYSATATYVASTHADALFGDKPYALVDPLDCDSGDTSLTPRGATTSIDLCAQRCAYNNAQVYDLTGDYSDTYTFGTSCYVDSDCAAFTSEGGETVEGSCETQYTDSSGNTQYVPRLENDTNRILKVDRDRQCSEWLSCSDAQTVWDERTNSYRTVCSDVSLCNEYSADGNSSFCSSWKQDSTATVVDIERYAERDVSWYGEEYSGLSVPNIYPVELLTQAVVSPPPGYCDNSDAYSITEGNAPIDLADSTVHGTACTDDADCDEGTVIAGERCVTEDEGEYNLVYNAGACDEAYGLSCTVGYCENTGESCASSSDCSEDAGSCLTGECYESFETTCSSDSDCSVGSCYAGTCMLDKGGLAIGTSSCTTSYFATNGGTLTYIDSVLTKAGTCMRGSCLLTPDGDPLDTDDSEGQICRGYPEKTSPFANEVVETWKFIDQDGSASDGGTRTSSDVDDVVESGIAPAPYETVSGFDNVDVCLPGEDCICNYKRYTYGDLSLKQVFAEDSPFASDYVGVCSGGVYDGALCTTDSTVAATAMGIRDTSCEDPDGDAGTDDGGECVYSTNVDTFMGLEGYCLERDTGINVNGDRDDDHRACVTWLPVDQLAGATDLFAKYLTAGFSTEAYYCADTHLYYNATPIFGCAEMRGETGTEGGGYDAADSTYNDYCRWTMECPDGYFAVGGPAEADSDSYTYQDFCKQENNACPYYCVPKNSVHADTGETCEEPSSAIDELSDLSIYDYESAHYGTPVYYTYSLEDTATLMGYYDDCTYYGASAVYDELGLFDFPYREALTGEALDDWTFYLEDDDTTDGVDIDGGVDYHWGDTEMYPACSRLLEVADGGVSEYNFAWTDRVAFSDSTYTVTVGSHTYSIGTTNTPFGSALTPSQVLDGPDSQGDPVPAVVPSCGADPDVYTVISRSEEVDDPTACNDDTASGYGPGFATDSSPQARDYIDWDVGESPVTGSDNGNVNTSEGQSDITGRLQQLFAKPLSSWLWDGYDAAGSVSFDIGGGALGSYDEESGLDPDYEWDVRGAEGNPPTVWALDLGSCQDTDCEEGPEGNLTVNSANNGNQSADEFFRAYLKFYAAADKNQLPIRRVIVDWGDDASSTGTGDQVGSNESDNYYRNHRGLANSSDVSKCDSDQEWGMTDDSCDPNYFSYSHIYTCTDYDLGVLPACSTDSDGNITNSPCTDSTSCFYRPAVHIRDNWGWCTGTCDGSMDDGDSDSFGCFEGSDDSLLFNVTDTNANECNYVLFPDGGGEADPWVYYDGMIVVTP